MFTGIVEEQGKVEYAGTRLVIDCARVLSDLVMGGSIAVNGVCLTAVDISTNGFTADLAQETLDVTNLGDLKPGDFVNLERPMQLSARLSGHIVQGHVDGTGVIVNCADGDLTVRAPRELDRFLVYKGSITLDGISLTIASVSDGLVRAAIIPHTWEVTNLATRKPGDRINIECDILAKHVDKLLANVDLSHRQPPVTAP